MRKVFRIFILILLIGFIGLGCKVLYQEFFNKDVFLELEKDPTLFIPLILTLLSFPSLLFNFWKLLPKSVHHFYKWLGILDFIFSILLFSACLLGVYTLINEFFYDRKYVSFEILITPIMILILLFLLSILLSIDNIQYQKSKKNVPKEDSIEDIGG